MILDYIIIIIFAGFLYESIFWCFRITKAYNWVLRNRTIKHPVIIKRKVYILIPVLEEASVLEDTADYFERNFLSGNKEVFLVFITTEKERRDVRASEDTIDIARKITKSKERILHYHYPSKVGNMGHQLNYTVDSLIKNNKIDDETILGFYNADSRPEKETLMWVVATFNLGGFQVFQQYGGYLGNISNILKIKNSSVLVSAMLWQTRWSIGFEIFNALKQFKFLECDKKTLRYPLNYCIGHGLFLTKSIFQKVGGFNTEMHNEDAILGLQLSNFQEPIYPVPYFDMSESPDTVAMLYGQKVNWYLGPLQAYEYFRYLTKTERYTIYEKIKLFILSSKLFMHAIFWITGPTLLTLLFFASLINTKVINILMLIVVWLTFVVLPSFFSYIILTRLTVVHNNSSQRFITVANALFKGSLICYFLHGASAYAGLFRYIKYLVVWEKMNKGKTRMFYRK